MGKGAGGGDVEVVEDCLAVFRMVLVADNEERENEGDLIVAAELIRRPELPLRQLLRSDQPFLLVGQ